MAGKIQPSKTAFQGPLQRRERVKDRDHLKFVASLPCVVCGRHGDTQAAHIRFGWARAGKREVGLQEKPDDRWAVPLCTSCHIKQHDTNEKVYWSKKHMSPIFIALALWGVTGDEELGHIIINTVKR